MREEILKRLHDLALKKSIPFCYGCYVDAKSGKCPSCGSDDLMRKVPGSGVEWGTEWIVKDFLDEIGPVDLEKSYEEFLEAAYGETVNVAGLELDLVRVIKETSPGDFRVGVSNHFSYLVEDENSYLDLFGNLYSVEKIKKFLEQNGEA
jgi:hypothetical protein